MRRLTAGIIDWFKGCVEAYPAGLCWDCDHQQRRHTAHGCRACACRRTFAFCPAGDEPSGATAQGTSDAAGHWRMSDAEYGHEPPGTDQR